jgi:hypothetical protein
MAVAEINCQVPLRRRVGAVVGAFSLQEGRRLPEKRRTMKMMVDLIS